MGTELPEASPRAQFIYEQIANIGTILSIIGIVAFVYFDMFK
jgi:hypothetical protein